MRTEDKGASVARNRLTTLDSQIGSGDTSILAGWKGVTHSSNSGDSHSSSFLLKRKQNSARGGSHSREGPGTALSRPRSGPGLQSQGQQRARRAQAGTQPRSWASAPTRQEAWAWLRWGLCHVDSCSSQVQQGGQERPHQLGLQTMGGGVPLPPTLAPVGKQLTPSPASDSPPSPLCPPFPRWHLCPKDTSECRRYLCSPQACAFGRTDPRWHRRQEG